MHVCRGVTHYQSRERVVFVCALGWGMKVVGRKMESFPKPVHGAETAAPAQQLPSREDRVREECTEVG